MAFTTNPYAKQQLYDQMRRDIEQSRRDLFGLPYNSDPFGGSKFEQRMRMIENEAKHNEAQRRRKLLLLEV